MKIEVMLEIRKNGIPERRFTTDKYSKLMYYVKNELIAATNDVIKEVKP